MRITRRARICAGERVGTAPSEIAAEMAAKSAEFYLRTEPGVSVIRNGLREEQTITTVATRPTDRRHPGQRPSPGPTLAAVAGIQADMRSVRADGRARVRRGHRGDRAEFAKGDRLPGDPTDVIVADQIRAVVTDIGIGAAKTGMLASSASSTPSLRPAPTTRYQGAARSRWSSTRSARRCTATLLAAEALLTCKGSVSQATLVTPTSTRCASSPGSTSSVQTNARRQ